MTRGTVGCGKKHKLFDHIMWFIGKDGLRSVSRNEVRDTTNPMTGDGIIEAAKLNRSRTTSAKSTSITALLD